MRLTKKQLEEIIDSYGELIGADDTPTNGSDLETQANHTTDYNKNVGSQPYKYDQMARFGFALLPFYEGKEEQFETEILSNLYDIIFKRYSELLKYYYKNPNLLKNDYRKLSKNNEDVQKNENIKIVDNIVKLINDHLKKSIGKIDTIDESTVAEDKMVEKSEIEMIKKSENSELKEKKIEKIAGLINKLSKKDVNKLINLLEINT